MMIGYFNHLNLFYLKLKLNIIFIIITIIITINESIQINPSKTSIPKVLPKFILWHLKLDLKVLNLY
jgi:hypothetical protein